MDLIKDNLKIEYVDIGTLIPAEYNPRQADEIDNGKTLCSKCHMDLHKKQLVRNYHTKQKAHKVNA